jgi:outer membrane autotransporter protein
MYSVRSMLRFAIGTATLGLSFPACAADVDMPYTKAALLPPNSWAGFYVGGNLGGVLGVETAATPFGTFASNPSGILGGGQLGYNFVLSPNWLLGFEGEFDWTSAQGNLIVPTEMTTATISSQYNWYAAFNSRLGLSQGAWLYYLKAGAAWINANYQVTNGSTSDNLSSTRPGWIVGVGVEYMFPRGWSAKLEYDYLDFGNQNQVLPNVGSTASFSTQVHEVKLGLNYHWSP